MANIQKLTYPYFTDGTTQLNAANLNPIIAKINEVIDKVNGGVTPTQTVATPTISITGTTATISCSTSGATIRYAVNGTPTESSGTIIANGGTITLSGYSTSTVIRAIAYKSGMTTSQVAETTYNPSVSPEAQAALAKFSSLSSAQQTKVTNLIDTLVSGGIYSKIHYLSFPTMAANVPEALQNILSDTTPPTADNFEISGGGLKATAKGQVNLTDILSGAVDYEDITLCCDVKQDTGFVGKTARILGAGPSNSSTMSRFYYGVSSAVIGAYYKGFDGNQDVGLDSNDISTLIVSHSKANSEEKYCFDAAGNITSATDTETISNTGLYISSATEQSENAYNTWFSGVYRFIMMADSLTDTQITALNTAVRTFLS